MARTGYGLCAVGGLGLLGLGGLSVVYPFDGRRLILPPGAHAGLALEIAAYALTPAGVIVIAVGTVPICRAYR